MKRPRQIGIKSDRKAFRLKLNSPKQEEVESRWLKLIPYRPTPGAKFHYQLLVTWPVQPAQVQRQGGHCIIEEQSGLQQIKVHQLPSFSTPRKGWQMFALSVQQY